MSNNLIDIEKIATISALKNKGLNEGKLHQLSLKELNDIERRLDEIEWEEKRKMLDDTISELRK